MNQIKIRLHIIKLAISITDNETIQLQMMKLFSLKKDNSSLEKIFQLLQQENYALAEQHISEYIKISQESIDFSFLLKKPKNIPKTQIVHYKAMPHILEKYNSMKKRYPLHKNSNNNFHSINQLIEIFYKKGYSEESIQSQIKIAQNLKQTDQHIEAGYLLLLCGLTQSKFAQLMLARELFSGLIFVKNKEEAFLLIKELANNEYPQAIYDLAQFYENGICTSKDTKKAQKLYQEAMNLGILRAKIPLKKLEKKHKISFGLLG